MGKYKNIYNLSIFCLGKHTDVFHNTLRSVSKMPIFIQCLENRLCINKIFQDGIFCHFLASMFSGLVTTIASMPVDIAKTRLQNQKIVDGKKCKPSHICIKT